MSFSLSSLLLFLVAVSVDSMTAGFSYGTQRVHVKPLSLVFLSCIPALFVTVAGSLGTLAKSLLPAGSLPFLSFLLLAAIGSAKLLESLIRHLAKKRPSLMGNWGCKIKQVNIIFTVYLSPEEANRTDLQVLSAKEALLLSLALSLDSILFERVSSPPPALSGTPHGSLLAQRTLPPTPGFPLSYMKPALRPNQPSPQPPAVHVRTEASPRGRSAAPILPRQAARFRKG